MTVQTWVVNMPILYMAITITPKHHKKSPFCLSFRRPPYRALRGPIGYYLLYDSFFQNNYNEIGVRTYILSD